MTMARRAHVIHADSQPVRSWDDDRVTGLQGHVLCEVAPLDYSLVVELVADLRAAMLADDDDIASVGVLL